MIWRYAAPSSIFIRWVPASLTALICSMTRSTPCGYSIRNPSVHSKPLTRSACCRHVRCRWLMMPSPAFDPAGVRVSAVIRTTAPCIVTSARAWRRQVLNIICRCFMTRPSRCLNISAMTRCWSRSMMSAARRRVSGRISNHVTNPAGMIPNGHCCRRMKCFFSRASSNSAAACIRISAFMASAVRITRMSSPPPCPRSCRSMRAPPNRSACSSVLSTVLTAGCCWWPNPAAAAKH